MIPYEDYKIYGPYKRKDGRQHIIAFKSKIDKITVSYPRYLLEISLGRYLSQEEDAHHIDGDFSNNLLENLEVTNKYDHRSDHKQKYDVITLECVMCGKSFLLDSVQHRNFKSNQRNRNSNGPFCSKICIGQYGKGIQLST